METKNGKERSVDQVMKLLADITGWSDQSLAVTIGFKRARDYDMFGESSLNNTNWGYVVNTTICGIPEHKVDAQAPTLVEALLELAKAVPKRISELRGNYDRRYTTAVEALKRWEIEEVSNGK